MVMTIEQQEKFETLVKRLEKYSRDRPADYQIKVALLAVLGYAYIIAVFLLLLAIIWGIRTFFVAVSSENWTIEFNLIAIFLVIGVLRLFWTNAKIPKGLTVNRQQAPQLFAIIDKLTKILQAPKCDRVFLTDELNAGVLQVPRLGWLGWQQNYLFLGLPLMQALSPEQFRAVLAHELGHLASDRSRFSNWIYRLRKTWFELAEQFDESRNGSFFLFKWFFDWYIPYFQAYSFVLARSNEYEADRCGVELAGLQNEADADINLAIYSFFLHKSYFPALYQQAERLAEPPNDAITQLLHQIEIGLSPREASKWLDRALAQKTDYEDTHPCLADRLQAIGYDLNDVKPPNACEITAAKHFFGERLWSFADKLDREWKREVARAWEKQHWRIQQQKRNLDAIALKAQKRSLTVEEMWKRACMTWNFQDPRRAIALFQQLLAVEPNHALSNYQLGKILIENNDPNGIGYLEKAIKIDPELAIPGCDLLGDFYQTKGKTEKAQLYHQTSQEYYSLWRRSQQKRNRLDGKTPLFSHQLPKAEIEQLAEQLSGYPEIEKVYLVRQKDSWFPEKAFYCVAIATRPLKQGKVRQKERLDLVERLEIDLNFSGNFKAIVLQASDRKLLKAIRKVSGACIYQR